MDVLDTLFAASRAARPHIALAEGEDPRVIEAALRAASEGIARLTLIGAAEVIRAQLAARGAAEAAGIAIAEPESAPELDRYVAAFQTLRARSGGSGKAARAAIAAPLGFAAMMARTGDADGAIGGAVATTSETVRAARRIIGLAPGADCLSSSFLMLLPPPHARPVIFADCGLIVEPDETELAAIAIASAETLRALTGETPRVAMLSFSTKGSVPARAYPSLGRIARATALIREKAPDLLVDGELQFDAAIAPEIAARKAPGTPLKGRRMSSSFPASTPAISATRSPSGSAARRPSARSFRASPNP